MIFQTDDEKKDILIYGNAGSFTEQDLRYAFEDTRIAVAGPLIANASQGKIRWYKLDGDSDSLERLFRTYEFGAVVFLSDYLTYGNTAELDVGRFRNLLRKCRTFGVRRVLYLGSREYRGDEVDTDRNMDHTLSERLCRLYASEEMRIAYIGCPYLADPANEGGYFRSMFAALESEENWFFPERADEKTDFIAPEDLSMFLSRDLDEPQKEHYLTFDLQSYTEYTFGEAAKKLQTLYPERSVRCTGKSTPKSPEQGQKEPENDYPRTAFGWFARYDVFRDPEELRAAYLKNPVRKERRKNVIMRLLSSGSPAAQAAEIGVGAVVMEFLNRLLQNSVQFRMIDVRLLYVVLMSSVYGMKAGALSALLASVSLLGAYWDRGINVGMIFFDPANWLPFMLLFAIAGFCGLERERHNESETTLEERNGELTRENEYTDQLYAEALDSKQEYRQNLIQSKGGFGRIYSAVQKLAVTDPSKIYGEAIGVIEETLENHSIAIYSVSARQRYFARLEVSSKDLTDHREKSLRLSEFSDVMQVLETGELWVNRKLIPGRPMYAYGVSSEGKLRILIVLWKAGFGQMSSYYENLIRVIGGLTQTFMLTAWSFQEATADAAHIPGTDFLTEKAFQKELFTRHEMADRGVSSYILFRIQADGRGPEEMAEVLQGKLRDTDMVTRSDHDGDYYVLALQADASSEQIILNRFRSIGLTCQTVEIRGGA